MEISRYRRNRNRAPLVQPVPVPVPCHWTLVLGSSNGLFCLWREVAAVCSSATSTMPTAMESRPPLACSVYMPSVAGGSAAIPPHEDDIYAMDFWMYDWLRQSTVFEPDVMRATHILLPSTEPKKRQLIRRFRGTHRVTIIDFASKCSFSSLQANLIVMSPCECHGDCGNDEREIIAPHSVFASQPRVPYTTRTQGIFFHGHLPRPYVMRVGRRSSPLPTIRYRLYADLTAHARNGDYIGATDVEENVAPFTVRRKGDWCDVCSYNCRMCYFDRNLPNYTNAPRLSRNDYLGWMRASTFCIVARGDNPASPKLGEAITSGCIPVLVGGLRMMHVPHPSSTPRNSKVDRAWHVMQVIIVDQPLPFEQSINYSAFSIRFDAHMVLARPSIVREAIRSMTAKDIRYKQTQLALIADLFTVRSTTSPSCLQAQLIRQMCNLRGPPLRGARIEL